MKIRQKVAGDKNFCHFCRRISVKFPPSSNQRIYLLGVNTFDTE